MALAGGVENHDKYSNSKETGTKGGSCTQGIQGSDKHATHGQAKENRRGTGVTRAQEQCGHKGPSYTQPGKKEMRLMASMKLSLTLNLVP